MNVRPSLGFIGAGKVGTTLARLLFEKGYEILVVHSRHVEHAARLADAVGAKVAATAEEVIAATDLTFLTLPDDVIGGLVAQLSSITVNGKAIVHTSGVHEVEVLEALVGQGAMVGSLHPIFPFAEIDESIRRLPGAAFGMQAEAPLLQDWLQTIISALDGQSLVIGKRQKALYHAALVFASNYSVTLYAIAHQLLTQIGAESEFSSLALNTLMAGMVRNLQVMGIPNALTGPLIRGDVGTIEAHLGALQRANPTLADLYTQLAIQSLSLAAAQGVNTGQVESLLRKKMDDADNHT